MTTTTTYMTCTEHGEVEVIPSNGTEYIDLCPVCVAVADAESAAAHADAWDEQRQADKRERLE